jgi:hypothetical protein
VSTRGLLRPRQLALVRRCHGRSECATVQGCIKCCDSSTAATVVPSAGERPADVWSSISKCRHFCSVGNSSVDLFPVACRQCRAHNHHPLSTPLTLQASLGSKTMPQATRSLTVHALWSSWRHGRWAWCCTHSACHSLSCRSCKRVGSITHHTQHSWRPVHSPSRLSQHPSGHSNVMQDIASHEMRSVSWRAS